MKLSRIYKDLTMNSALSEKNNSKSNGHHLNVKSSNFKQKDINLQSNFLSFPESMKLPEIIVSPPSPSPFPQVSTSQDSLNVGSKCQLNQTTGVNNMPVLDLDDIPALCEHEYEDDDILILESVFCTRSTYIRPIESVYMTQVVNNDDDDGDDENDHDTQDDRMEGVRPTETTTMAMDMDTRSDTETTTTTPGKPVPGPEGKSYKLVFTKNPQPIGQGLEMSRCCWLTSTLQVVCNLPGVETDFPRYNCMLNDIQRNLFKLLQILQSDDPTLDDLIKINENDTKLKGFLTNSNPRTINPTSLIKTIFTIQDPFIDYFSGFVQSLSQTKIIRCNYASEFARVLLDKILVGTRLRSRFQATIICRDMCRACKKKSPKTVMKYCRFFPLLLSESIKAKNNYEISFIDILRNELCFLPLVNESLNQKPLSSSSSSSQTTTTVDKSEVPIITLNDEFERIKISDDEKTKKITPRDDLLNNYIFSTPFSNQTTDFDCKCKSCLDSDGVHRQLIRETSFVHLPEILVLSVIRDGKYTMEVDYSPMNRQKGYKQSMNKPIRIPMEMDMCAHLHPEHINESTSTFYRLHGFVTQKDGRYIAYTHISNNYQWYKIDDSQIIPIDLLVGSFPTEGVSLLFYILQLKKRF